MKHKLLFILALIGVFVGVSSAVYYGLPKKAQPPAFTPATNPYSQGIYANGIVESAQGNGSNINLFPEVAAPVTRIFVKEGDEVAQGAPLLALDDSVQSATARQLEEQAAAALALLRELKAQPRPENLRIAQAQVEVAQTALKTAHDQYDKQKRSYDIDPGSVSRDALDSAANAVASAVANLDLAQRNYELTKAGAWSYDIVNQERQYQALLKAAEAARALLAKYVLRAPLDGVVLAINTALGSYVSAQGVYNTYTQASNDPALVMGAPQKVLAVRVYVDEILVNRLPAPDQMRAEMSVRGTEVHVRLKYERMQPYLSPKIQLSDQRQERVDVRVLPLIFTFENAGAVKLYPGQLVDVFIAAKAEAK
ncbi:MAG TPA: biotin/lipoyl-binding protein [Burkholderiales bacterium]|nr:biotin/lipoyl-binding protein [Burkholderiales bacterium]